MGKENPNQFHDDELVTLSHYDKRESRYINTIFPKIGGRLRLAHEENQTLSIATEIIQYDQSLAVISATVTTAKGKFTGLGVASVDRDRFLAVAILELAETRGIARALRFAGYGVEFCGAEEVSHLEGMTNIPADESSTKPPPGNGIHSPCDKRDGDNDRQDQSAVRGSPRPDLQGKRQSSESKGSNPPDNKGDGNSSRSDKQEARLTNRQLNYIITLSKNMGQDSKALDEESIKSFGVKVAHLKISEASSFIDRLNRTNK
ncbi:MAG: hypothetical protein HQK58_00370 [Deltaproteobacteria bacterium]|nr:hypothetical protein [Deltaproteobacteria bacterium]